MLPYLWYGLLYFDSASCSASQSVMLGSNSHHALNTQMSHKNDKNSHMSCHILLSVVVVAVLGCSRLRLTVRLLLAT
jgi:hypothetical protein